MSLQSFPQWLDKEAWAGFDEMRKAMKKPLTSRAAVMILKELQKLKDAGHDPNAALDQSTNHCWADVYEPKEKQITHKASSDADKTQQYLAEQRAHAAQSRIRRVA